MKIQKAFGTKKIIALVGEKNSGKSNNLTHLIENFRKHNKTTSIYAYGMPEALINYLKKFGVKEISSLKHLIKKENCLIIIDEMQKLKLNDRRYKDTLQEFVDFVYHNNVWVILSSPNIREFNSVIGGVIERWLLKDIRIDQCIRGSQLRQVIEDYKGRYKSLGSISIDKDKLLVIDESEEMIIRCPYVEGADTKKNLKSIF